MAAAKPARPRRVRIALAVVAAMGVLLVADTAAWWWLTGRMQVEAAAWQAQRNAEGYVVVFGPAARGGWPLLATVTVPDVSASTDPSGAASWHADGMRLEWSPFSPRFVAAYLLGTQTVRMRGQAPVTLTAERLDLLIPLGVAGQAAGIRIDGRGLSLPVGRDTLAVRLLTAQLGGAAVDIVAGGVTLPGPALPFGGALDRLEVQAHSTIPIPALPDPAAAAAAWQRAGGQAVIQHAALRWGPLDGTAAGTLALTPALQPAGAVTLHLAGYAEALEALVRAGTVNRNQARVFTAVLGLMARPNPSGSPEAELPLTLADGLLKLGGMPLTRLAPLAWP